VYKVCQYHKEKKTGYEFDIGDKTKENIQRKECIDSSPKQYVTSEHSPKLVYKTNVLILLFIVLDEL